MNGQDDRGELQPAPLAQITSEQWKTVVWLTAEFSWWRSNLADRLDDAQEAEVPVWRTVP